MRIERDNKIFESVAYRKDENRFYNIKLNFPSEDLILYSDEESYVIARGAEKYPTWIWTADDITPNQMDEVAETLATVFFTLEKNKLTAKRTFYEYLVQNKFPYLNEEDYFEMGTLECHKLKEPRKCDGQMEKATLADLEVLAQYFYNSCLEMDGVDSITMERALEKTKERFESGTFFVWRNATGKVVCTATYRITGKQAKITSVYTPKEDRRKAYATNLIHDMSGLLLDMGLTPLLYTDYNYSASNTAYINAGYEDTGVLINFSCRPKANDAVSAVQQAKESFNRILANQTYAGIIRDDKHLKVIIDLAKTGNYERILDIGTGTGYLAFPLAKMYPEAKVYGIDIAEAIMEKNQEIVKESGISNLTFLAFDGLEYPFDEESFDLIVSRYAFHHFPEVELSVKQMYRLLKKGGKILISDPMRHPADTKGVIDDFMGIKKDGHIQFYSSEELESLFLGAGFTKEVQSITDMKFPFPPSQKYLELYDKVSQQDKAYYDITREENTVWVKNIQVGNTLFVKR
ncbi:MAG: methyltransferase domain-containing protein [Lachnospiraceae bacterium]|nr:methyltransferase domain-containing protein [Lachnospiraceae bacterium]